MYKDIKYKSKFIIRFSKVTLSNCLVSKKLSRFLYSTHQRLAAAHTLEQPCFKRQCARLQRTQPRSNGHKHPPFPSPSAMPPSRWTDPKRITLAPPTKLSPLHQPSYPVKRKSMSFCSTKKLFFSWQFYNTYIFTEMDAAHTLSIEGFYRNPLCM